ncbi:unnamed protein product [Chironomus riparius]|uniref:Uncharacterized protein n=1 Tax=Chironomus riparius TaxID=315576 RepID=A0A9N9S2Q8_9DIPT|nr:unnamed protein product [Chironomus riparius]
MIFLHKLFSILRVTNIVERFSGLFSCILNKNFLSTYRFSCELC